MSYFVEVIMDDLSKINQRILLYLNFGGLVYLYSGCVDNT